MKKLLAVITAAIMLSTLTACGGSKNSGSSAEKVNLKVWGPQEDQKLLGTMIDSFKKANPDMDYNISLGVVSEADAQARLLEDPQKAADIFSFPDDQIYDLVNAGALYEITRGKEDIESSNIKGSVDAATVKDALYAYPMTADNGFFMYYDRSVVSDEQAKTLEGILDACEKKGKKFFMDISNGWYTASFFLSAGCSVGLDAKGKQTCNFNNEAGVKAGETVKKLCAHPAFLTGDDAVFTGGIGGNIAAGVSGAWTADAVKQRLGENYAAAKLPTANIGGTNIQLKSFAGYKLLGVNSSTKEPVEAMKLAQWITNEQNQLLRFKERAAGPSNKKAAENEEVKKNVALTALSEQNKFGVSQRGILSTFWSPVEAFGTAMENKNYSKSIKQLLDSMVEDITT